MIVDSTTIARARSILRERGPATLAERAVHHVRWHLGRWGFWGVRAVLNRVYRRTDAWGLTSPVSVYSDDYYRKRTVGPHISDARQVAMAVHRQFSPLSSAIDLGCAVGHYLKPLAECGVYVHGVDGHPAARKHAVIPADCIEVADLRKPYEPDREFDVALCIEVAEHLAPRYAGTLVDSLVEAAPAVVFTAAPPGQGGTHHVNEQPRGYWKEMFEARGYHYQPAKTQQIRAAVDLVEVPHVANNLFVFEEGRP